DALPPTGRVVAQVHDQNARRKIGQLAAFGRPVIAAGAFGEHRHAGRESADAMWLDGSEAAADFVRFFFAGVLDRSRGEGAGGSSVWHVQFHGSERKNIDFADTIQQVEVLST